MTRQYQPHKFKLMASALVLLLFAAAPPLSANPKAVLVKAAQALVKENDKLIQKGTLSYNDTIAVHLQSAQANRFMGNYDEAAKHVEQALYLHPGNKEAEALMKKVLKKKEIYLEEGLAPLYAFGLAFYAGGIGTTLLLQSLTTD